MDKFKAFLSDKKNTPIVGAVAAIILVLVVLFYLKQFGIIGGGSSSQDNYAATPDMSQTGSQETTPPDMSQGSTGSTTTAQASAAPLAVGKIPPMLAYRRDPFMGYSGPPKKEDALIAMLPIIGHIRLAPASLSPPPGQAVAEEVLPPQPMRRVAGIMWGTTVKAILESGGKTIIVRPGDVIPDERVRVESIEPSGLTLTTLDTKRPMSIHVNLAGAPGVQDQSPSGNMGNETPPPNVGGPRPRPGRPGGPPVETPPPGF